MTIAYGVFSAVVLLICFNQDRKWPLIVALIALPIIGFLLGIRYPSFYESFREIVW